VDDLVVPQTERLLDLLTETNNKATFFILGDVAEDHPRLVKKIYLSGHEVATHFMHHDLVYTKSPQEFSSELRQSVDILEQLIGEKVLGFRAPSWSISLKQTPWFWEILIEEGLMYSSSRFPAKTYLYGDKTSPIFSHRIGTKSGDIWEIPPSCMQVFNLNIPFSGGVYFRVLPHWFIKLGINWYERRENPAVLYLHPKEIDEKTPSLPISPVEKIIHKIGTKGCFPKLKKILQHRHTISFKEWLISNRIIN
jgi:polysaccharide deacetylase family protein (PEP-CTERM system associated)